MEFYTLVKFTDLWNFLMYLMYSKEMQQIYLYKEMLYHMNEWWYYLMLKFLMMLSVTLLYMLMILLSTRLFCMSINLPYGHAWNTVVMCDQVLLAATLNFWTKLQRLICTTVGPSLTSSLELLTFCQNATSLNLFYRLLW